MGKTKNFKFLFIAISVCFCVNSYGQRSIFFEKLVEFDRITTDSGRAMGEHLAYRTSDLPDSIYYDSLSIGYPAKFLSNKISRRERIVSVNKKGEVYWCNWPDEPIERNRLHIGRSWLDSTWYEPAKPYPCFKTVLKGGKIYNQRCDEPRFMLLEATLKAGDTVRPYVKSQLADEKMPVNQTGWYRYYVGDTIVRIGTMDVPCFLFEDIGHLEGELRKDQQFVEKTSLLSVLTVSKYYDQDYDPAIKHYRYTLERTVVTAPSIYIEELIGKKN